MPFSRTAGKNAFFRTAVRFPDTGLASGLFLRSRLIHKSVIKYTIGQKLYPPHAADAEEESRKLNVLRMERAGISSGRPSALPAGCGRTEKNRRRMNLRRGVTGAAQKRSPPEKPHRLFWRRSLHSVFGEPARGLLSGRFCGPRPGMSAAAPGRRAECYFSEPLFSRTLRFSCPMRFLMAAYCDSHTSR